MGRVGVRDTLCGVLDILGVDLTRSISPLGKRRWLGSLIPLKFT